MSQQVSGSYTSVKRDELKNKIKGYGTQYFGTTLNLEPDLANIILSQMYYESRFNVNAVGPSVSIGRGTGGNDYMQSAPVQAILTSTDTSPAMQQKKVNIYQGLNGMGLGQVMGWNFIKGASASAGKQEIERTRPDLASQLTINAGDDIKAFVLGDGNTDKAVLAAMVLLESKWKGAKLFPEGWGFSTSPLRFASRIEAAIAAYLGLGAYDLNGTTPTNYAASIVRGSTYKIATGNDIQIKAWTTATNTSATTDGSNQSRVVPPGCM